MFFRTILKPDLSGNQEPDESPGYNSSSVDCTCAEAKSHLNFSMHQFKAGDCSHTELEVQNVKLT